MDNELVLNDEPKMKKRKCKINGLGIAQIVVPGVFLLMLLAAYLILKLMNVTTLDQFFTFFFSLVYGIFLLIIIAVAIVIFEIIATIIQIVMHAKKKKLKQIIDEEN